MAAEGDVDAAIEQGQRGALVLETRVEGGAGGFEGGADIERPAVEDVAVGEGKGEDQVVRRAVSQHHCVEIERTARRIDHRGAGDADRVDIAAAESGHRDRGAEVRGPVGPAGRGVERVDDILRGGDDDAAGSARLRSPEQRLGVDMTLDMAVEAWVAVESACGVGREAGGDVGAEAGGIAVIDGDGAIGRRRGGGGGAGKEQGSRKDREQPDECAHFSLRRRRRESGLAHARGQETCLERVAAIHVTMCNGQSASSLGAGRVKRAVPGKCGQTGWSYLTDSRVAPHTASRNTRSVVTFR